VLGKKAHVPTDPTKQKKNYFKYFEKKKKSISNGGGISCAVYS
jgi:hypothetical protein